MSIILAILVSLASARISDPIVGVACYGSPLVVGASYVPASIGQSTTVVNIWAELLPSKEPGIDDPIAWIYKNAVGDYYLQVNYRHATEIRRAFQSSVSTQLLSGGSTDDPPPNPQQISSPGSYDKYFAKLGAQRASCFHEDFSTHSY